MKKKQKKVYVNWFLSYLLILIIPILAGLVIYAKAVDNNKKQADMVNENFMKMATIEFDNRIRNINTNLGRLAMNNNIQLLSNAKEKFHADDQYVLYSLYRDVKNTSIAEEYCDDIFIFFKNTETVVSLNGNMSLELYYHLYMESQEYMLPEFKKYLAEPHFQDFIPMKKGTDQEFFLFTMSDLKPSAADPVATVGVRINTQFVEDLLHSAKWMDDERMQILIINSKNEIMNRTEMSLNEEHFRYDLLEEKNPYYIVLEGEEYLCSTVQAEQMDWKFVFLMPRDLVESSAKEVQRYALLSLFLCVLFGFFMSYYLTRRNYHPLKGLLSMFQSAEKGEKGWDEDEYTWLTNRAEQFFTEHSQAKQMLAKNERLLKEYHLLRLLQYPYDELTEANRQVLQTYNLEGPEYMVFLFAFLPIESRGEQEADENHDKQNSLQKFILINIFTEAVSEHFNVEMTELGDFAAAVVNFPEESGSYPEILRSISDQVQQLILEKFRFRVVILASEIHAGIENVYIACSEAREAGEYISLLEEDIIYYREIQNKNKTYNYPLEMENKIINAIKACDSETACGYIHQVFDQNYTEGKISADIYRCLLFDMLGTILKGIDESRHTYSMEDFDLAKEISTKLPLEELKYKYDCIVEQICREMSGLEKKEDHELSEKVERYIREHYHDPDLNISHTGFYFNMTPAYISTVFKKQTGKSLLNYINSVRVEEAVKLLQEDYSVVDAAERVGFRTSGAFIRVFKKHTGVTPGQMKKVKL